MTEPPKPPRAHKVLLALQGSTPAPEALAAAAALARSAQAELAALFVEDLDLLRLAALPFTHEVGRASGAVLPLEVSVLQRTLRWQAERLRQALAIAAQEMALPWSFQVARGSLLEQAMAAMTSTSLVVFSRSPHGGRQGTGMPPRAQPEGMVSALLDPSDAGLRTLAAALELAQGRPERLSLLAPAASAAELETLRRRVRERLKLQGGGPTLHPVATTAGELSRETRRRGSRALVLSTHSLPDAAAQLRVLLEVSECTVVLVS